ncbi:V-type ATP synthase subunit F [Candidatus Woesearchaeota archaeon]|nr:V-type ATP synthase subunit F [Candidatus Woesearchaeota archaeon]
MEIAAIGREQFTVGFQLAGIRTIITVHDNDKPLEVIKKIAEDPHVAIVIIDDALLNQLNPHDRADIEDNIQPVFIPLSTEASQENLRRMIIKSVGVDLYKQ